MRKIVLSFLTLLACIGASAQVFNSGILFVGSGGILATGGSFTNTVAATYHNNGSVFIGGNLSNDQAFLPAGSGSTIFNGVAAQALSGSSPFRSFNITLNNAAGLTLTNRLSIGDGVAGVLTLTSGKITTGNNTQDVYFNPGSSYTGFDATRQVIGYVTKSGTDDFDFPIGDGSHTADLVLTALSGTAEFQVLYSNSNFGASNTNGTLAVNGVFAREWWNIAQTGGSVDARVTLKWNDARNLLNHSLPAGLVVANFNSGAWQSAGGTSTSLASSPTGTVGPSNLLSGFGPFTFGSISVALPIVLASFTVVDKDCQALLSWTTTIEQDAASFDIQQSTDGVSFTTVASVRADDTASTYHLAVAQPTRQAFYRLRLSDLDGQFHYSGVDELSLHCIPSADRVILYPNPLASGINLQVRYSASVTRGAGQLQLFDETGKRVYSMLVTVNSGDNLYTVPVTGLAQGIYTMILKGEGWSSEAVPFTRGRH